MYYVIHFAGFAACKIGLDRLITGVDLKYAHDNKRDYKGR